MTVADVAQFAVILAALLFFEVDMESNEQAVKRLDIYNPPLRKEICGFFAENTSLFVLYLVFSAGLLYWGTCLQPSVGSVLNKAYGEGLAPISIAILMVLTLLIVGAVRLIGPVPYSKRKSFWVVMALAPTKFMISLILTYYAYLLGFLVACWKLGFPVEGAIYDGIWLGPVFIVFFHFGIPRVFFESQSFKSSKWVDYSLAVLCLLIVAVIVFIYLKHETKEDTDKKVDISSMVMCWYGRPAPTL